MAKKIVSGFPVCHTCHEPACVGAGERARCEKHFVEEFEKQVRHTIRQYKMITPRQHIVVALSGGKDSVVLLHLLSSLRERRPMKLSALLVDEGISGYRSKTIVTAKRECKAAKVPLHIVTFKKEIGKSLDDMLAGARTSGACTYCGVFRRRLLEKGARKLGADRLAIGHNLDDAAQTVLLNLYRNDVERLMRFGPTNIDQREEMVPRIRPLIEIPEKEVALYAELKRYRISHQACPYASEAMRQTVRTQLNEMEDRYAGTKKRVFNAWLGMQKKLLKIKSDAGQKAGGGAEQKADGQRRHQPLQYCITCKEPSSEEICVACKLMKQK